MTKALMRMIRRTTLPTTDTSSTVELAPSPIMGAGTEKKGGWKGREEKEGRLDTDKGRKSASLCLSELLHMKRASVYSALATELPFTVPATDNGGSLGFALDRVIIMRSRLDLHY